MLASESAPGDVIPPQIPAVPENLNPAGGKNLSRAGSVAGLSNTVSARKAEKPQSAASSNGGDQRQTNGLQGMGAGIDDDPIVAAAKTFNYQQALDPGDFNGRLIVAEDLTWNCGYIAKLSKLCLDSMVKNFQKRPMLGQVPLKHRAYILEHLPVNLPLSLTAKLIQDEGDDSEGSVDGAVYWKRACLKRFAPAKCDRRQHGDRWKITYFELLVAELIENYVPEVSNQTEFIDALRLARDFVFTLKVSQLRPSNWISAEPQVFKQLDPNATTILNATSMSSNSSSSKSSANDGSRPGTAGARSSQNNEGSSTLKQTLLVVKQSKFTPIKPNEMRTEAMNHVSMRLVFNELVHLREVSLFYGMNDCGMGFSWNLFGITMDDMNNLSHALNTLTTLETLDIRASKIEDELCKLLCIGLKDCASLRRLDLSHNRIRDVGARALATLLAPAPDSTAKNHFQLTHLNLSNNRIGTAGALALGKSLAINTTLQSLNLGLNCEVGDEGTSHMVQCFYQENYTLHEIILAGCQIGVATASVLVEAIKHHGVVNARLLYEKEHPGQVTSNENENANGNSAAENIDPSLMEDDEDDDATVASLQDGKPGSSSPKPASRGLGKAGTGRSPAKSVTSKNAKDKKGSFAASSVAAGGKAGAKAAGGAKTGTAGRRTTGVDGQVKPSSKPLSRRGVNTGATTASAQHKEDSIGMFGGGDVDHDAPITVVNEVDPIRLRIQKLRAMNALSYPIGLLSVDISSNSLVKEDPCGKSIFDAVKVNKWVMKMDIRGTEISEHYSKAISAVIGTNKDSSEPGWLQWS